jgi:hypothetical protein
MFLFAQGDNSIWIIAGVAILVGGIYVAYRRFAPGAGAKPA